MRSASTKANGRAWHDAARLRLLLASVCLLSISFPAGELLADPVEIDPFEHSVATLEIIVPDGSTETVTLFGPSEMQVYFEGAREGDALDDNGNGRDEVATELTNLTLSGQSPLLGPVTLDLNSARVSLGEMEEQANNTSGLLDVPPFAATGLVDSFFDVFFVIEVFGIPMHNVSPMRMRSTISHKPPASTDTYESLEEIRLYDPDGNPSGLFVRAASYVPNPTVEVDPFERSVATVVIIGPDGSAETVSLYGPSEMQVYFEGTSEGDARDDDRNGRDEVATELTNLMLSGQNRALGPVTLDLNSARISLGEMEEQVNNTSGLLDLPPFAETGRADSFFDVFFVIEVFGIPMHNVSPMRMSSAISHKPPASTDRYESLEEIRLYDPDGNPSGLFVRAASYVPNAVVEVDRSSHSTATVEIIAPTGSTETVQLTGPSEMQVYFEGTSEGDARDDNGNGRDEVATELTSLMLRGQSPALGPGPVTLYLNPARASLGEMEEQVNNTPRLLDLPPFAATGRADSFFDVFFVIEVSGIPLHNLSPMRMSSAISHKPPAATEPYESLEDIQLYDVTGNPSGLFIGAASYNFVPEPRAASLIAVVTLSALARIKRRRGV